MIRPLPVILRQLALLACTALAVFLLVKAGPVDPVDAYLGPAKSYIPPEQRAALIAAWGLDQSLPQQFLIWLRHLAAGDPGWSHSFNAPVATVIGDRIGPSLVLAGGAWLLSGLSGYLLGLVAGLRAGRWPDRLITLYAYTISATPAFWLSMAGLAVFSVTLGWTPICCSGPLGVAPDAVGVMTRLHHLALPLLTLTVLGTAQVALHTRQKVVAIMASDPVTLARAHRASPSWILRHHLLRNAAIPALTATLAGAGEVISGAILAEQVFAWPGLGQATITAGLQADLPLLLAISLTLAATVAMANLLADFLAPRIDPRSGARR